MNIKNLTIFFFQLGIRLIKGSPFIQTSVGPKLYSSLNSDAEASKFLDPSSNTSKTYSQLVQSCKLDPLTGVSLLPFSTVTRTGGYILLLNLGSVM